MDIAKRGVDYRKANLPKKRTQEKEGEREKYKRQKGNRKKKRKREGEVKHAYNNILKPTMEITTF